MPPTPWESICCVVVSLQVTFKPGSGLIASFNAAVKISRKTECTRLLSTINFFLPQLRFVIPPKEVV